MTLYDRIITRIKYYFLFLLVVGLLTVTNGDALAFNGLMPMTNRPLGKDFELKDSEGRIYKLSNYRGQTVLINFWATWCPPCLKEMPSMERLWKEMGEKGFAILALNVGESAEAIASFSFQNDLTFPLLMDQNEKISRDWLVRALPSSYLVDRQGKIAYQVIGERDWDDPNLKKVILDLILEGKKP
ncbi:MAG: TlpA family protein disulfide reductase [Magnetococcus sp. YQC-9]